MLGDYVGFEAAVVPSEKVLGSLGDMLRSFKWSMYVTL